MSNFFGEFFYVLGGKIFFKKNFKNILATALKSYIKWLLYIYFFFLKKFEKVEKTGIISTKFSLRCTPSVILGYYSYYQFVLIIWLIIQKVISFQYHSHNILVIPECRVNFVSKVIRMARNSKTVFALIILYILLSRFFVPSTIRNCHIMTQSFIQFSVCKSTSRFLQLLS